MIAILCHTMGLTVTDIWCRHRFVTIFLGIWLSFGKKLLRGSALTGSCRLECGLPLWSVTRGDQLMLQCLRFIGDCLLLKRGSIFVAFWTLSDWKFFIQLTIVQKPCFTFSSVVTMVGLCISLLFFTRHSVKGSIIQRECLATSSNLWQGSTCHTRY